MLNLKNTEIVKGKEFKIYTNNVQAILDEIVEKKVAKVIYDDLYKSSKKQSFCMIEDAEVLYMTNDNKYFLYIAVPQDSYLSQMGIILNVSECIVVLDEDKTLDYLEHKVATDIILKYFTDKLIWDKHDVINPELCYVKDRKVYDINQALSLKLYTDEYIRYEEEICEYEELYIDKSGIFLLLTLCNSVRTVNSHLYFRNKESGIREKSDIVIITEKEALSWYIFRFGNECLDEFYSNLHNAKFHLLAIS